MSKDPLLNRAKTLAYLFDGDSPHPTTVSRWIKKPQSNFPKSDTTIAGRDYWKKSTLDKFKGG